MNKHNMRKLISHLRELPAEKVYMDYFFSYRPRGDSFAARVPVAGVFDADACGTAACIGGWAATLARKEGAVGSTVRVAREWLGMQWEEADGLFYGNWRRSGQYLGDVTRDQVVEELERRLAAEEGQDNGTA